MIKRITSFDFRKKKGLRVRQQPIDVHANEMFIKYVRS
jgi:hypothetical protein